VTFGQRRLGTRVVATLMPLTAVLVTQPLVPSVIGVVLYFVLALGLAVRFFKWDARPA